MIDSSSYKYLKVERDGNVVVVTMNRPEVRNAVNIPMHEELERIFEELNQDTEVKALILTGAGKAFCAGGDVSDMKSGALRPGLLAAGGTLGGARARRLIDLILALRVPFISAVNGSAAGLGATLALFADIIIAAQSAKFNDAHVKAGLVAGDGGVVIWPMLIGLAKAKEFLLTGDVIDAKEAERIGLVNRVVSDEELLPKAKEIAKRLASGPALAIGWTKASMNKKVKQDVELMFDTSYALETLTFLSEDHKEAAKAFVEKRQPKFTGK